MNKYKILLTRDRSAFSTKWVCNFATNLVKAGHDVTLLCDSYENKVDAPIDSRVTKINLSGKTTNPFLNLWHRLRRHLSLPTSRFSRALRQIKPDIIICYFLQDLFNVTFLQKHNIPIILMMHNPPDEVFAKHLKHFWKRKLFHQLIKKVAAIQVLMPEFVPMVQKEFPHIPVMVIPNQVSVPEQQKDYSVNTKTIIHVAQIAKAKRQRDLIEAFIPLAKDFPDWKIKFFGRVKHSRRHQQYMRDLGQLIEENHLEQQILFPGFSHNITDEYLNSEIAALPSYTEGFGYGLADGLALGLPGIGYDFALAINRILVNEKSGYLVKDIADMSEKLRLLMQNVELRQKMGKFACQDMQKYAPQKIIEAWLKLITEVLGYEEND
ncbi:MAG: glycosyltransferase [Alphaproteobacteria bacterium]|nr:glycosyltransferase [Alphaproteobacteria bacterium]